MPRKQYTHTTYCQNCHQLFQAKRLHARTCSDKCRKQLSRAGRKDEVKPEQSQINNGRVTLSYLEHLVGELMI